MRERIFFSPDLKGVQDVFEIENIDGLMFRDFAQTRHAELLSMEGLVSQKMPGEFQLGNQADQWVSMLGIANLNYALATGYEKLASGLLKRYYRKKGLKSHQAAAEANIEIAIFTEIRERWEAVAKSLQERIWQAGRIEKRQNLELTSQR